jgi:DNA helicase-2/ATP-dependent DNA helicase PcrA
MQELNKEQNLAVRTTEGYIRVISGAGSGKTRIITNRYVYLVNELGIPNANILCITFTNNAAKEMKQRINKMIKDNDVGYICTFHSLSAKALREDIHCVGIVNNFSIMDNEDQNLIFKKIYKKLGITNREYHYENMRDYISLTKSRQELITNSEDTINYIECLSQNSTKNVFEDPFLDIEQEIFNEYIKEQKQSSMLDYNDLINIFLYILVKYGDKKEKWQQKFQYIMCDEFNDIDYKQYKMLKILSKYHKNLLIVGDPDQTIYSWRGSNVNYIINFEKDFINAKDIVVSTNYRSVPSILNIANSLIKHNKNRIEKDLKPFRKGGNKVIYHTLRNPQEESKWVAEQIKDLHSKGEKLSDIAVLYRNNNL